MREEGTFWGGVGERDPQGEIYYFAGAERIRENFIYLFFDGMNAAGEETTMRALVPGGL